MVPGGVFSPGLFASYAVSRVVQALSMGDGVANSNGRVCVVSGGSSGIGLATAARFLAAGYRVVICGRDQERLDAALVSLAADDECVAISLDVSESDAGERLVRFATERFGRIDVLVNNAGVAPLAPACEMSRDDFETCLATNVGGVFGLSQAAWPALRKVGGGAIINISSLSASDPFPGLGVYGASKAWVELFTQAMAEEGREHNIRVLAVSPGAVDTPLLRSLFPDIPQEVRLAAEDVAGLVFQLSQPEMAHVTGQAIKIRK